MQNIPPLEQVFNKGKDKNTAGLRLSILNTVDSYSMYYISK